MHSRSEYMEWHEDWPSMEKILQTTVGVFQARKVVSLLTKGRSVGQSVGHTYHKSQWNAMLAHHMGP